MSIRAVYLLIALLALLPGESRSQSSVGSGSLDPIEGKYFILSVAFELDAFLKSPDRVPIVSKIINSGRTSVGYALSVKAFPTSVRPQLFWSASGSEGGVFTFGDYPFRPKKRYVLTLISRPREFAALYIQERAKSAGAAKGAGVLGGAESEVVFLGGHDLTNVPTPRTNAVFNYKAPDDAEDPPAQTPGQPPQRRQVTASVVGVLVAEPEKFPDARDKLIAKLKGAPERLSEQLSKQEIALWELAALPEQLP